MSKPFFRKPIIRISLLVFLVAIAAGSVILLWPRPDYLLSPLKTGRWFTQQQLGVTYDTADSIEITWPDGTHREMKNLEGDR